MKALLVYPLSTDFAPNAGIIQKMEQQTAAFEALGLETTQVHSSSSGLYRDGALHTPYWPRHARFAPLHHRIAFYKAAYQVAASWKPDLIYLRYPRSTPVTVSFMAALKARLPGAKLVVEVATYPYDAEVDTVPQRVAGAADKALRRTIKRWVDLIVTFHGWDEIFGVPCFKTANGISPEAIPLRTVRPRTGAVRALAVANLAAWHGYDRFIEGMAQYGPGVELDLVGDGPAREGLERLAHERGLKDRVRFLGVRRGEELDTLFDQSDIAVGSLGDHRRGLQAASSLKGREYCARGIPFVFSTTDPDFPKGRGGWLEVSAADTPVPMQELVALAKEARANPAIGLALREYAEQRLSWRAKLAGLLARPELQR